MTPPEKKPTENERAANALNSAYVNAESLEEEEEFEKLGLTESQLDRIETISKYATAQKGVVTVLVTLLTKKNYNAITGYPST